MRSSQHRGEAGGGWVVFPPLLATHGRIHKGDCDMRTGAIFARGSCRALAWLLALGVAAVLSAGEAAAQKPVLSQSSLTLNEGASGVITLTVDDDTVQDVAVTSPSVEGGTFDISWRTGSDDNQNGVIEIENSTSSGTIRIPANGQARLTITANDDSDADDARASVIFAIGTGGDAETKTLILRSNDPDTSAVIVNNDRPLTLTVDEGVAASAEKSYTVKLGTRPTHQVTVAAAAGSQVNARIRVATIIDNPDTADANEDNSALSQTLTFTTDNWNVAQTVYVSALSDANTRNGTATITHKASSSDGDYSGVSGRSVKVVEYDSVRTITLSTSADSVDEGEEITITATLGSTNPNDSGAATLPNAVTVSLDRKGKTPPGSDYSVSDIVIGADSTAGSTKLMANEDADETNETLTLVASVNDDGDSGIFTEIIGEEITVTLVDDDTYTLEADKDEVAEGGTVTLTVKVDPAAEVKETKVSIDLFRASGAKVAPAKDQDADDDGNAIIDEGEDDAEFTLTTAKDTDSENETIVVRAMLGTTVIGPERGISISVLDTQAAPEYTLGLTPDSIAEADGETSVMVKVTTNKAVSADTTLTLAVDDASTATSPGDYSLAPESPSVMIAEGEKEGMATLTVTPVADNMDEPNETIVLTAMMDGEMVGEAATLTLVDSDSANSGITASADALKVIEDAIMAVGGLQAGGEAAVVDMSMLFDVADPDMAVSYSAMSSDTDVLMLSDASTDMTLAATILKLTPMMEGMSTVTFMAEAANGMMEVKTLSVFTCTGVCVTANIDVGPAGTPVPALPLFGQGLLAAFLLAAGAYRRYRNR